MLINRTPFRISFLGGGTDYPDWYLKHGGCVLATTINKYCYLTCRYLPPFFEHKYRIVYVKSENCKTIEDISHPAVKGILKHLNWNRGLEIHHDADLPARGGLGTSSSFTVGFLHALSALRGNIISKKQLALDSINIEQNILMEAVGSQDQVCASYGGFNCIRFLQNGEITVAPITISDSRLHELESHLMLFFTGINRTAATVAKSYFENIDKDKETRLFNMSKMVEQGISILTGAGPIEDFGSLMNEAWLVKRQFSDKITNSDVDAIYNTGIGAGATGGKILGAGGGGFMLFFVKPELQKKVRKALNNFIHVPFRFDSSGSQIIYYDPQEDFSDLEEDRETRIINTFVENSEV